MSQNAALSAIFAVMPKLNCLIRQYGYHTTEQSLIEAQVVKGGSNLHSDDVGGLFAAGRALL